MWLRLIQNFWNQTNLITFIALILLSYFCAQEVSLKEQKRDTFYLVKVWFWKLKPISIHSVGKKRTQIHSQYQKLGEYLFAYIACSIHWYSRVRLYMKISVYMKYTSVHMKLQRMTAYRSCRLGKKMMMVKQNRRKEPKEKFSSYTGRKIRRAKPA